jgi:hypothetical protein
MGAVSGADTDPQQPARHGLRARDGPLGLSDLLQRQNSRPSSVTLMLRVVRENKRTPRRCSSRLIDRLTAAGVRPKNSAVAVKLPNSAALQNCSMLPSCMVSTLAIVCSKM